MEKLIELFEITQWRAGCVYRTKSHGMRWVSMDAKPAKGWIHAAPSTSYTGKTFRMV